jgi:RimJ/RimL family protein N-acetyltransferase
MEFATGRMRVRRIGPLDYEAMMEVYGDLELMRYVGDSSAIAPEDCARWIHITLENYEKRGYGLFLVEALDSGEHLGFVGITHPGGQIEPEIKYVIRREHWGKGLAQELVAATCGHAHAVWNLEVVIATVHPENDVSNHVLQKTRFTRVANRVDEDGTTVVWEHRN